MCLRGLRQLLFHKAKALKDSVVGVAGVCSYTFKLGTFFVMPLTLLLPIFEKISLRGALAKSVKLWVLHKNDFLCITPFCQIFPELPAEIFFRKLACVMSGA